VKLQFDANQPFQRHALDAVLDLFDGQPRSAPEYSVLNMGAIGGLFGAQQQTELGVGNALTIDDERLRRNARAIQLRNEIDVADPAQPLDGWELFDIPLNAARRVPHFSVEMETGTGKTYVYLRTILELSQRYGFQKFVIVVPSVAIREGVLKNIEVTADHFKALYNNLPFESYVYDAKRANALRQFALSTTLQILIINIDAFRKNFTGTDDELKSNVIYRDRDGLSSHAPIDFVRAARPIVIIDEPQSVDSTGKSQEAIRALNPLCTLRYSATHRNPYNLMYRLDPLRAFELGLVKKIVVASPREEGAGNDAFIKVEKVDYKNGIKAKLRIQVQGPAGPKEKGISVKQGHDLFVASGERQQYAGYQVSVINAEPGSEYVEFANGRRLAAGTTQGGLHEESWRAQIKHTVKRHLDRELQLRGRGIKVLTLFFIDRVANYRDHDENGTRRPGKFADVFGAELAAAATLPAYSSLAWLKLPVEQLHNGYFAQDKHGAPKDTRGDTQADDDVYNLIMREKERLLSEEEPLRFIFSHSALREGWDNPNVFQICTLNESSSAVKKRQEIGRGLRLPVDQHGVRVHDEQVNQLWVMANESYEDFARALQGEYEQDCGVTFGKVPVVAFARLARAGADGTEEPIGRDAAAAIHAALVQQGMLDATGRLLPAFDPRKPGFALTLPPEFADLSTEVIDLVASYRIERHIKRERSEITARLKKEVQLSPEFQALWDRIKPKTTYRVEFSTDTLVERCVAAVKQMPAVVRPKVVIATGALHVVKGGVATQAVTVAQEEAIYHGPLPDILAYLQNATELTRGTLVRILKESGRLGDFLVNPQAFMDDVAQRLQYELHRLLVDGIKYERLSGPDAEWEMRLFENQELVDYLSALEVNHSLYDHIVYDSQIEREFARQLDARDDIKLFVKLPRTFVVETPVGNYNPDWAIVKSDDAGTLYMVKETKSTLDFGKLRTTEADKVNCGRRHFEAIGVPFSVVVTADQV
jgi:type III restriction enzyme